MLQNYLKTALRILVRQKGYSAINIFGLTLGISCCILIVLYVTDELSFDRFHADADRIYRTNFHGRIAGRDFDAADTGVPMAEALVREVPAIESTVRLTKWGSQTVHLGEQMFTENRFLLADSNFFDFFSFRLLNGNPADVLLGPNKLVMTESAAKKYFGYTGVGDTRPLGKLLVLDGRTKRTVTVTGIAADPPANSHLQFDMLLSMESFEELKNQIWLNSTVHTYFKLHPGASVKSVDDQYNVFIEKYCAKEIERFLNLSLKQFLEQGSSLGFSSQKITDIHLKSQQLGEFEPGGNIQYVYLFGVIAVFIILLACINFMNLNTARSANRAKEVGVRKTIGALRSLLIRQFLVESYIYTVVSVLLAIGVVYLLLTPFNVLTGKGLTVSLLFEGKFITGLLLFVIAVGLVAGSYPAFYLTSFRPVDVLKGKMRAGMKSSGIRNTLVIFQFFISIALIICTLMVYRQLQYVQNQNLGFEKGNVVSLIHTMALGKNGAAFKNELLQHPEFLAASYSNRLPPNVDWNSTFTVPGTQQAHLLSVYCVDSDHLKTMKYEMVKGRFFSRDFPSDSLAFILNETAARQLGYEDFEGKKLISLFNTITEEGKLIEAIGVIKDFNYTDLHAPIGPLILLPAPEPYLEMALRLSPGDVQKKIDLLETTWKKFAPDSPFEFSFVDQNYDAKFKAEQRMGKIFILFTSLAIVIACLGLFGLATFTAEQRAKEIGIRKVMGATVPQILLLLSLDFAKLITVAFVVAIPVTWYGMDQWLQGFAYRVNFDAVVVAAAGVLSIGIALLTISFQSLKAALINPAQSLKSE